MTLGVGNAAPLKVVAWTFDEAKIHQSTSAPGAINTITVTFRPGAILSKLRGSTITVHGIKGTDTPSTEALPIAMSGGDAVVFEMAGDGLEVEIVEVGEAGEALVRLHAEGSIDAAIARAGVMPLPPYIRTAAADPERYQTVFAQTLGSAAAPTAGLHFTPELLERVRSVCSVVEVDLQVGLDTFRPVTATALEEHEMHSEAYAVTPAARAEITAAVAAGRRVVAIGTTTTRVLETIADAAAPDVGRTSILLQPGVPFRTVGALVTNFHLPRSTLLALVMGLAGESLIRDAYAHAVREGYRFYSFGDAMVIV